MQVSTTFQGFTNFETFTIALFIDNNQTAYDDWHATAGSIHEAAADHDQAVEQLAGLLESDFEIGDGMQLPDPMTTLLQSALDRVDWSGIAEHLLAD